MQRTSTLLSIFSTIALLISACGGGPEVPDKVDPAFREYISGYSSNAISSRDPIRVRLVEAVEDEERRQEILDEKIFEFDPAIQGKTEWADDRTLEFIPEQPLPNGKEYYAAFHLEKVLKDVPEELRKLEFGFRTLTQDLTVHIGGLKLYDMEELQRQKLDGILKTADMADEEKVEKALRAEQSGRELPISWDHDVDGKTHHFSVDSIRRKEEADSVLINWTGEPLGVEKDGKAEVEIPAMGDFKVMEVEVENEPEQYLSIRFSDPLRQDQDLNGILYLEDGTPLRTSISGNEVKAYPEKQLNGEGTVKLTEAVENILGHRMEEPFSRTVLFEDIDPQVKLLGSGTILPESDGLHLPFKAVNLSAVDIRLIKVFEDNIPQFFQVNEMDDNDELRRVGRVVHTEKLDLSEVDSEEDGRWTSYHLDLEGMIEEKGEGAIYRVELGFPQEYSTYPCNGDEDEEDEADAELSKDENGFLSTEMGGYRSGGYYHHSRDWRGRDDPCSEGYYYGRRNVVSRNILASNIGLLAKKGEGDRLICFANDIPSSTPLSGARVQALDYQQQVIGEGKTDEEGKLSLSLERDPYLLVAKKGEQKGYLRVDGGSAISTSKFDVGGQSLKEGLKGFPFTERGVYRPGDTVHLSFILDDREMPLPSDHPVKLVVRNARNDEVHRTVKDKGEHGYLHFPIPTSKDAPTGNWHANIQVGGAEFHQRIRVETIKPNRLRIEIDWEDEVLHPEGEGGTIRASWLHGATAKGLRTEVHASLQEKHGAFPEHSDYEFQDPLKSFSSGRREVFEGRLDDEGELAFDPDLDVSENAPGMLRAHFTTRVYEKSGNSSVDRRSRDYSPFEAYVGTKMPETRSRWGTLQPDTTHEFSFMSVDEKGDPLSGRTMNVELYKIEREWWYSHTGHRSLGQYVEREHHRPLKKELLTTDSEGKATMKASFDDVRYGYYFIRTCDEEGKHCSGKRFRVSRYGRPIQEDSEEASLIAVSTDKEEYEVGETATVTVPSGGVGKILLSLENGTKVLETHWLDAREDSTRFSFKVKKGMTPNIYVHATLLQPHGQEKNELPLRLYGIAPVSVYDPATELEPEIEMPEELTPETSYELEVSEAEGKAMSYSIAVVDKGLLDLTNFQTPEPWEHFYAKEAHGVKTWDLYDNVMGALSGKLRNVLAVGGGGESDAQEKGEVDRFEPMVRYLGPFELEANESKEHRIQVPNYIGSVRTMVVAGQDGAYGSTDTLTPVKKDLMVLSTLPRVIGPKEKVEVPVSVFAMDPSIDEVEVELRSNELFEAEGGRRKTVSFEEPGEKLVSFQLNVKERIGKGEVKAIVRGNGEEASHKTELKVRNPNPVVTHSDDAVLSPGEEWSGTIDPPGMAGTNSGVLEFSSVPPMDSEKRLEELIRYPHGCVEQIVSAAFPQLYLDRISDLSPKEKSRIDEHVHRALEELRSFQTSGGSFSYWPHHRIMSSWGSNYAGHFMLEAEQKGYKLPAGLKQDWLEAQSEAAREWEPVGQGHPRYRARRDLHQAYRLFTLALADEAILSAMNRLRRKDELSVQARWRLAGAYQLAGQHDVASELVEGAKKEVKDYREMSYTYGSSERDRAMILETLTLMGREKEGAPIVRDLAEELRSDRWLSTQTTAYSLLAITKFLGESGSEDHMSYSYAFESGKNGKANTQLPLSKVELTDDELQEGNRIRIENRGESKLFVRTILHGKPVQGREEQISNRLDMEVDYRSTDGEPIDVGQLEQGTEFIAEVTVKNPGSLGDYKEMALTRIFPSGWEIRGKRLGGQGNRRGSGVNYEDVRDDRVLSYFHLSGNHSKQFEVRLHASYLGRFYMPGTYCEAMYDGTINAQVPGRWVEVVKPGELSADASNGTP